MDERFAAPRHVTDASSCLFYHAIDLPGHGLQDGLWDLRPGIERYLPALSWSGSTVLDVGAASGYVTFELERRGADVIAVDQADGLSWDTIPFHDLDKAAASERWVSWVDGVKNAFWLAHRALGSSARALYCSANDIPVDIGPVDIAFLGNILQHLRDPLGAITTAASLADCVVVTEAIWRPDLDRDDPLLYFLPALRDGEPSSEKCHAWWQVSSSTVARWLDLLGFRIEQSYRHEQLFAMTGNLIPHYTVVAARANDPEERLIAGAPS
jgi:SAM-dependent methyltransferase